jgi:tetratricopeptide (TPR) repeat protein
MKKLLLAVVIVFTVTLAHSQKRKVNAADAYLENGNIEAAEEMMENVYDHKRSFDWPKTYIVAARLATAKYMEEKNIDLLKKAFDHYMKAMELNNEGNGRFKNEIKMALTIFPNQLANAGVEGFNNEKYEKALVAFENVLKINDLEMFQEDDVPLDTVMVYNTGLAAVNAQNWEKAAQYLKKAFENDFGGGDVVIHLHQAYEHMQDSSKMVANLRAGIEKYPDDVRLITELVNYYLVTGDDEKALTFLNRGIERDPDNKLLIRARGGLYDKSGEYDKAIEDYKRALEIDPNYYEPLYNIGVIYYNKGLDQMNAANDETEHEKFQAEKAKADSIFKKSIPYMERAHKVMPDKKSAIEILKGLYYRFEMDDKYEEMNKKLERITGGDD